jgi:hypothetical protein
MATIDLTRSSTYFTKHNVSVRAQQGRIFSDDDHNDNERIHSEDMRRSRVDIIGPAGSPDAGFLIANPGLRNGFIDFDVTPGTLYVGGNRLELETKGTYQGQFDWLNMPASAMIAPPAAGTERFDFVGMLTWQQPSASVEDSETFETAFGGVDTAVRMRTMQRVVVVSDVATAGCAAGWATWVGEWAALGFTLSPENELIPNSSLKVGFAPGTDPGDLCSPPVAGGYLGSLNQAIRVQYTDAGHFTWGFDNASPLYRVRISTNAAGKRKIVNMLTPPKDQPHWPLVGQNVEILPWSAVLVNGEKLAEYNGFHTKVDASYDPDTGQFSIVAEVPPGPPAFGEEWKTRPDAVDLAKDDFFYMRIWYRGSDTASPAEIPFVAGTPVTLGQTGLTVTFTGTGFTGDFWIIAARPDTPDKLVPWILESGRGPNGIQRFIAALGVIEWDATGGALVGTVVQDCRDPFPPLTRLRSCCTYTVGDGVTSFGKFTSIQKAIHALPADGGEVCILQGKFKEHVVIKNRHDIIIHGCDKFTVLADDEKPNLPLITITDSQGIEIHKLAMHATVNKAIVVNADPKGKGAGVSTIHVDNIDFSVRDRTAIEFDTGRYMRIRQNSIQVQQLLKPLDNASPIGKEPAIFSRADDVLIEQNVIAVHADRRLLAALGGIQIGGGSERVDIHRNKIDNGNGNGITLGSYSLVPAGGVGGFGPVGGGFHIVVDANGCIHIVYDPGNPGGDNPQRPESDGNLVDIRIVDNDILNMGTNGIAAIRLLSANFPLISVIDCQIELNRIRGCMQLEPTLTAAGPMGPSSAFGGVVLAGIEYLTLRNNWIGENGKSFIFPICGFYAQFGLGLVIEGNQIERNGPLGTPLVAPGPGPRAGIYLNFVMTPLDRRTADSAATSFETGFPAFRIANNLIVSPMGPAIFALGMGSFLVEANDLASHATDPSILAGGTAFAGATVWIANLGKAIELVSSKVDFTTSPSFSSVGRPVEFDTGLVSCNDNQIRFESRQRSQALWFSSVFILSADDVSLEDNQCQCLSPGLALITNGLVISISARIADNRFTEQAPTSLLSGFTLAAMNSTTDNQGTHCFLIAGLPPLTIRNPNRSYVDLVVPGTCERFALAVNPQFAASGLTTI